MAWSSGLIINTKTKIPKPIKSPTKHRLLTRTGRRTARTQPNPQIALITRSPATKVGAIPRRRIEPPGVPTTTTALAGPKISAPKITRRYITPWTPTTWRRQSQSSVITIRPITHKENRTDLQVRPTSTTVPPIALDPIAYKPKTRSIGRTPTTAGPIQIRDIRRTTPHKPVIIAISPTPVQSARAAVIPRRSRITKTKKLHKDLAGAWLSLLSE